MKLYHLTPREIDVLKAGAEDPDIITGYFLRKPGQEIGWQFDQNFTEEGAWQKQFCQASQSVISVIGGVATGKTVGVMVSAFVHAITTPDFRFLHIARELFQASLGYRELMSIIEGTPAERLVYKARELPRPYIEFKFWVGSRLIRSTMEYSGLGDDRDALQLFSWRGDWISIEEAGRIDDLLTVVGNLQTRLTGSINGRPLLGRLSLISNPLDNPEMWEIYDRALTDPENYLSIAVSTYHNKNVTSKQVEMLLKNVPEKDRERYITGSRTETEGGWIPKRVVMECSSKEMSEIAETSAKSQDGWVFNGNVYLGWMHYETPVMPDRLYILVGDPGTGAAPSRNAPCIQVWDCSFLPEDGTARLAAFWWGNGNGSIMPFVETYLSFLKKYKPILAGMDATATQKSMAEILSADKLKGQEYSVQAITGLDFSGGKKYTYLTALRFMLEGKRMIWPDRIKGMHQIISYDPVRDTAAGRIAQDVVVTTAMAAYVIRALFSEYFQDSSAANLEKEAENALSYSSWREAFDRASSAFRKSRAAQPLEKQVLYSG